MRRTKTMLVGDLLEEFFSTWRAIVGDRVAAMTSRLRLENHILYVHVTSSTVRSELFLRRYALTAEINRLSGLRLVYDVRFR